MHWHWLPVKRRVASFTILFRFVHMSSIGIAFFIGNDGLAEAAAAEAAIAKTNCCWRSIFQWENPPFNPMCDVSVCHRCPASAMVEVHATSRGCRQPRPKIGGQYSDNCAYERRTKLDIVACRGYLSLLTVVARWDYNGKTLCRRRQYLISKRYPRCLVLY